MPNLEEKILLHAARAKKLDAEIFNSIKRKFLRVETGIKHIPTTAELLKSYHNLVQKNKLKPNTKIEQALVKRAVRTLSGVSIVTVLTKPFPCPGQCIYCPTDARMPKSYLADEPAAARALTLRFDPFEQVKQRIAALKKNGHPADKIELIVKGGTWNAYPLNYQYWFILRCFEAANNKKGRTTKELKDIEKIKKQLAQAEKKNEIGKHRVVGLTLETRPDFINPKTALTMRELGCTRLEIGVQTTDKKILQTIKRGHGTEEIKNATKLLKQYGFKVDFHLMPQLPGSTPKKDLQMLKEIFSNPDYRPDMIKIYPCTVIENSELYEWLKAKKYHPYSDKKLIEILKEFKTTVPRYVRISRLIRDIPSHHIHAGNKVTNLRQVIQSEMLAEGTSCQCLRCREIGHTSLKKEDAEKLTPKLFVEEYESSNGKEYFLSFEDKKRCVVFAFCRLRIDKNGIYPAFIRELHTYGQTLVIGTKKRTASQHKGWGKKLMIEAERIAKKKKCAKIAVISGIGVRDYYRHLGYKLENTYLVKKL